MNLVPDLGRRLATPTSELCATAVEKTEVRRRDVRVALLLGLICLFVYNANLRLISSGDAFPARFIPFGLWRDHSLLLDPILDAMIDRASGEFADDSES